MSGEKTKTDLRTYSSPLLTRFHFNMTNDNTNKMITKIIPTDIAANIKYITWPYLDQFQKTVSKISHYRSIFAIVPGIIQNRFHFSLFWDYFWTQIFLLLNIKMYFLYQKFDRDIRFWLGTPSPLSDTSVVGSVFLIVSPVLWFGEVLSFV